MSGSVPSRPSRTHMTYGLEAAESVTLIWPVVPMKPPLCAGATAGHDEVLAGTKKR